MLDEFFTGEQATQPSGSDVAKAAVKKFGKNLTFAQIKANKKRGKNWANVSGKVLFSKDENNNQFEIGGIKLKIELLELSPKSDISEAKVKSLLSKINLNLISSSNEENNTFVQFRTGAQKAGERSPLEGRLPPGKYSIS